MSDSLAGRCAVLTLPGLSVSEIRAGGWAPREPGAHADVLTCGGFPELWAEPDLPVREYYESYVATYL